ncbi:VPRE1 protein, partial [Polyodon spathula]|nr:VPRE1 protein [Polyodon spathula]
MILFSDPVKNLQFSGSLDKVKSSGVFNVSNSQAEDSVTYYCAVEAQCLKAVTEPDRNTECVNSSVEHSSGLSYGDEVRPWKDLQTSEQSQETKIYCNYSLSNNAYTEYLFWYQQIPGRNPRYILHRYKVSGGSVELRSEESDRRFIGHLNTSTKMTYLSISNTQLSDSALYYCALGTTVMLIKVQLLAKTSVETL